jgi:hypothetical protein
LLALSKRLEVNDVFNAGKWERFVRELSWKFHAMKGGEGRKGRWAGQKPL